MKHMILGLAAVLTVATVTPSSARAFPPPITNRCVVVSLVGPQYYFVTNPGPVGTPCTFWTPFAGWLHGIFG